MKPITEINVPKNLPNKNPATNAKGEAKPKSKIQIITNAKNIKANKNVIFFSKLY